MNWFFHKRRTGENAPGETLSKKTAEKQNAKLRPLVAKALEFLSDKEVGKCVIFDIPGSKNMAVFGIEKGYASPEQVCYKIDVMPRGSDMATGYYFHKEESLDSLRAYFIDPETTETVIQAVTELNDSVNRRDD